MEKYFKSFWFWVRIGIIAFMLFSVLFITKRPFDGLSRTPFHSKGEVLFIGAFMLIFMFITTLVQIKNKDQYPNWRGSLLKKYHMLDFFAWVIFTYGIVEFLVNRMMGGSGFNYSVVVLFIGIFGLAGMQLGLKICKIRFREK